METRNVNRMILILILFVITTALAGCSIDNLGREFPKNTYTRMNEEGKNDTLAAEPGILNWVLQDYFLDEFSIFDDLTFVDKVILNNSFAGLFKIVNSKLEMDLVKNVSISESKREYVLELKNSKWSNGKKITANDVVNSWIKYDEKSKLSLFESIGIDKVEATSESLITIKLSRNNEKLLYYLTDLSYKVFPNNLLDGEKLGILANSYIYSGKYEIEVSDGIEYLKLIRNPQYYDSSDCFIDEIHIVSDDVFSENKNDNYEFYIDSSQDIYEYKDLLISSGNFNYLPTGTLKSILINPKFAKLNNKYDRIKIFKSLDIKAISDYSSTGLATISDTFAVIDNWRFDYGYLDSNIISNQDNEFDFKYIKITYIDNLENQMIYDILELMFRTNYGLNLISDGLSLEDYIERVESSDYELLIKDINKFGSLNDSYLVNLKSQLPNSYSEYFAYDYFSNLKRYHHTSDLKYLKKTELNIKLDIYISPLYNCGFPVMGDERLDFKEFYNSDYLDFSAIDRIDK